MSDPSPDPPRVLLSAVNPEFADGDGAARPEPTQADQLRGLDLLLDLAAESGEQDLVDWYLDKRNEVAGDD